MAVPKRRLSHSKTRTRRSHHFETAMQFAACANCKSPIPSHVACPNCGMYKGRQVMDVTKKLRKIEEKRKAKANAA